MRRLDGLGMKIQQLHFVSDGGKAAEVEVQRKGPWYPGAGHLAFRDKYLQNVGPASGANIGNRNMPEP